MIPAVVLGCENVSFIDLITSALYFDICLYFRPEHEFKVLVVLTDKVIDGT